jgi:hypothetical protein
VGLNNLNTPTNNMEIPEKLEAIRTEIDKIRQEKEDKAAKFLSGCPEELADEIDNLETCIDHLDMAIQEWPL